MARSVVDSDSDCNFIKGLCFSWALLWVRSVVPGVLSHPWETGGASGVQAWVPLASSQSGGSFSCGGMLGEGTSGADAIKAGFFS